jgi:ribulose-phosphate 3-epimerase
MKVSVSILSSKIKASDIVKKLDETECDYIHVDIMDGKFVENKTWTFGEIKDIVKYSKKKLDVHLMVEKPTKYIDDYALLNTDRIAFHYEAVKDVNEMIEYVKNYGLKVGLAINPDTPPEVVFPYLKDLDEVLVMSVYPGKSGQSFISSSPNKIKELSEEINGQGLKTIISVDGGINDETGVLCKEAGVNRLVSASYLHKNLQENINILKKL